MVGIQFLLALVAWGSNCCTVLGELTAWTNRFHCHRDLGVTKSPVKLLWQKFLFTSEWAHACLQIWDMQY